MAGEYTGRGLTGGGLRPTITSLMEGWLPFVPAEYEQRQAALRARMDERKVDAVLLSKCAHRIHLP